MFNSKNKKASAPVFIISVIVILFIVGICGIIFSKAFLMTLSELKGNPIISANNRSLASISVVQDKTIPLLDYVFFFIFIAFAIGLIISAVFIDMHPVFIAIFFLLLVVGVVLAGIFGYVFIHIAENPVLLSTYEQFTLTHALMNHIPLILAVLGFTIIIIFFAKPRGGGISV